MSEDQPLADSIAVDTKGRKGHVDTISQIPVERRVLLLGAAAITAGAFSSQASAAPQAPDLSAALAKFRATIPGHFDREYVENAVIPFFLGSIYAGERPILPMVDLPLSNTGRNPVRLLGDALRRLEANAVRRCHRFP